MPKLTFNHEGDVYVVDGEVGESVMRAATRAEVPGVIGECGGELSCATCHVIVRSDHVDVFPPTSRDEEELLDVIDEREDCSRLSCQMPITEAADGLIVDVPSID